MTTIKKSFTVLTAIIIISGFISCGKKKAEDIKGTLTFITGDVMVNNKQASTGANLTKDDILKTGENSIAVLQFSQLAAITIRSNTEIKILSVINPGKNESSLDIYQQRGSTFNKIVKKGTLYNIKTPTAVAGVRGTTFDVTIDEGKERIRLLQGKIKVSPLKEGKIQEDKSIELSEGNSVTVIEEKIEDPVAIPEIEIKILEKFDKISLVPLNNKSEKSKEPLAEELKAELIKIEKEKLDPPVKIEEVKEKIKPKKPISIEDLMKKYGNLSVVSTKDGKLYTGSFKQVGNKIEVITTTGKIVIDSNNIEKISRYKN